MGGGAPVNPAQNESAILCKYQVPQPLVIRIHRPRYKTNAFQPFQNTAHIAPVQAQYVGQLFGAAVGQTIDFKQNAPFCKRNRTVQKVLIEEAQEIGIKTIKMAHGLYLIEHSKYLSMDWCHYAQYSCLCQLYLVAKGNCMR